MSQPSVNGLYRISVNTRWGVRGQVGDCAVRYMIDGEEKSELFRTYKEAAEFCVGIGLDHFFVFMPDNKWHRIVVEQEGAAE